MQGHFESLCGWEWVIVCGEGQLKYTSEMDVHDKGGGEQPVGENEEEKEEEEEEEEAPEVVPSRPGRCCGVLAVVAEGGWICSRKQFCFRK